MRTEPKIFSATDFRGINNSVVILDVVGTLVDQDGLANGVAADLLAPATLMAVRDLAARNSVYLCSDSSDAVGLSKIAAAIGGNVTYHSSRFHKPSRAFVANILPTDGRRVVVIGDQFFTDALLAITIDAPFIRVLSLRRQKPNFIVHSIDWLDALIWKFFGKFARPLGASGELTILTQPPATITSFSHIPLIWLKVKVKNGLFLLTRSDRYRTVGGPQSVLESLLRGLTALGIPYLLNPWSYQVTGTVGVVSGVDTLRWAIEQKKKGFIKTLIAGPNIVVAPADENDLIKDQLIDRVVVPSEWNKKWWMSFDQLFESKAAVWPAGVADNGSGRDPNGVCLVYSKNADEKVFQKIMEILWTYKLPIVVSHYGTFRQEEYFRLLKKAKMLVYLSPSESQGIALNEAWMADIPTLVWNRGYFMYQEKRFEDSTVGAPYLTAECGLSFESDADFERKLIEFLEKYDSFKPRNYSLAHFTDAICARKYLDIVEIGSKK